ncbi:MAG: carboxymuconolactone decarboxylase family protein [Thermoguttaceae bacterium]
MSRIHPVSHDANPKTKNLLGLVEKQMGMVPNMIATMARSPAVAEAYLAFSQNLAIGGLPLKLREQIALTVSEANQSAYCLSAHSFLGRRAGLTESDLPDARHGTASDPRTNAALVFARRMVEDRGHVNDEDLQEVRHAGYTDSEIVEIIANVALTLFTNYFNEVAATDVDFPLAPSLAVV